MQVWMSLVLAGVTACAEAQSCDEAWAQYNEFKRRNKMEPGQYALTTYGAQVRAACGPEVLPVPPGTDTPHVIVRRPHRPPPPEKPKASAPKN